jgi:hypothetical protein
VGRTLLSDALDVDSDSDSDSDSDFDSDFDSDSNVDLDFDREGHGLRGRGKTRFCSCFWVAQRFTAAITAMFSMPALAAEGRSIPSIDLFRSLLSWASGSGNRASAKPPNVETMVCNNEKVIQTAN